MPGAKEGLRRRLDPEQVTANFQEAISRTTTPLVASIEYLAESLRTKQPRIIEVGPVPTGHYHLRREGDVYDQECGIQHARSGESSEKQRPPIYFLAERNPAWKCVAVSPHNIPLESKEALFGKHADIFMHELGPERKRGFDTGDALDLEHFQGVSIARHYPYLIEKLGGKQPNIIFGKHVFDGRAQKRYDAKGLVGVVGMFLPKGGLFVSHVHGSDPEHSFVPFHEIQLFDGNANMKLTHIFEFPINISEHNDYVFVWKKKGDFLQPAYQIPPEKA